MMKFTVLMAVVAVATAAPGIVEPATFSHGPALFPGTIGFAPAAPAIIKGHSFGAVPVSPIGFETPALVKSAVVAPASVAITPAVIKTPIVGGHLGGFGGHLGFGAPLGHLGHLGGIGSHYSH